MAHTDVTPGEVLRVILNEVSDEEKDDIEDKPLSLLVTK